MAGSPRFKIYDAEGIFQAATKRAEEAAAVVGMLGKGARIKLHHGRTLWIEGVDGTAYDSWDDCAQTVYARLENHTK